MNEVLIERITMKSNTAERTLRNRLIGQPDKTLALAQCVDFDSRWIGQLPICFDGSISEIIAYATDQGCRWLPDDDLLYGGRFEHPDKLLILYPV